MSKTLITGATGGLGHAVATGLKYLELDQEIAVLVRDASSEKAQGLAKLGFEVRTGDYSDKASIVKALEGIDTLYFVSGNDIANRNSQHKNVVEAATEAKVEHLVYTSVSLNDLSEDSPLYGAMSAHIETEKWILESGLKYTFLRHNLYSEVVPMFLGTKEQLLSSKMVYLPTGSGKTAFVSRDDLAEAGVKVLANVKSYVNQTLELNGSEKVTFEQIAQYLSEITGESISYVSPEVKLFEETMTKFGVPAEYIGMMVVFSLGMADGVFDSESSDLEILLGRKPVAMADFLKPVYQ